MIKYVMILCLVFAFLKIQAQKTTPKSTIIPSTTTTKPKKVPIQSYKATAADSLYMNEFASEICPCITQLTDSFHPIEKKYYEDYIEQGHTIAKEKRKIAFEKLNKIEKKKFTDQLNNENRVSFLMNKLTNCFKAIELKYTSKIKCARFSPRNNVLDDLLIYYTNRINGCKVIRYFYEKSEILE